MLTETIDYKAVFDSVDEMIFLIDEDYRIISFNKASREKLQIDETTVINKPVSGLLGSIAWSKIIEFLDNSGLTGKTESLIKLNNGTEINVLINITANEQCWKDRSAIGRQHVKTGCTGRDLPSGDLACSAGRLARRAGAAARVGG